MMLLSKIEFAYFASFDVCCVETYNGLYNLRNNSTSYRSITIIQYVQSC